LRALNWKGIKNRRSRRGNGGFFIVIFLIARANRAKEGRKMKAIRVVVLLISAVTVSSVNATLIEVGSGVNTADVLINWKDGYTAEFAVKFGSQSSDTLSGLGLFDIIEVSSSLTTVRDDFGWGVFINGISLDGHSNVGFGGGDDWWQYWTKNNGETSWTSSWVGAADRVVHDGDSDGWVYGSANAPVPEPATVALMALGGLLLGRKKQEAIYLNRQTRRLPSSPLEKDEV
jgi:hypothetical protein